MPSLTAALSLARSGLGPRQSLIAFVFTAALALATDPAAGAREDGDAWTRLPLLCEQAAARASASSGVPLSVLRAIALTETGRTRNGAFRPWPWTVNMEGKGEWFDSYEEAYGYVRKHHARGARSYDVGCFQINYRWHGEHFASLEEMLDPDVNAAYAARFLTELHAELGDWSRAAGAYHSRTPHFASRYRTRFDRIRARLGEHSETAPVPAKATGQSSTPAGPQSADAVRDNRFPLLVSTGARRGLSSLVPLEIAGNQRLIDVQGE